MASRQKKMDAIALLKADHRKVEDLFAQFEKARDRDRKEKLVKQICMELSIHTMIEEEIFYPAARKAGVDSDLLDEAQIEHGSVKQLIAEIGAARASEPLYDARLQVLGEYVRHHVKEEESELFPACRNSEMDMGALGARLRKRKDQLLRKLGAN